MHNVSQVSQIAAIPTRRRSSGSCNCDDVIALVAKKKNLPLRTLMHRTRRPAVARARQLAMYLSHVMLGKTLVQVGQAFGRDRTTVSYACALMEDLRDDPAFDAEVTDLEELIGKRMAEAAHG